MPATPAEVLTRKEEERAGASKATKRLMTCYNVRRPVSCPPCLPVHPPKQDDMKRSFERESNTMSCQLRSGTSVKRDEVVVVKARGRSKLVEGTKVVWR